MPEPGIAGGSVLESVDDEVELSDVLGALARQWLIILLSIIIFVAGGLAYATLADKIYVSSTRVLLDPRDKQIVGSDIVRPSQGIDAQWIETQVDLVTAYSTLKKVVERERLIDDPEFGGAGPGTDPGEVLRSFAEHVRAERSADTYVIDIIVASLSAEKAARLATAVAAAFIESSTEAKQAAARQANALLLKQIDDLKAKAREADDRVEAYRQAHGMVDVEGRPLDQQTLKQLNEVNVTARLAADAAAERQRKLDSIMRANADGLAAALDTVDSPVLGRLKLEYALSLKQQAELGQTLGGRHPRMQALDADIVRTRGLIMQELRSLAAKAGVDAELAKAAATSTAAALATATQRVNDTSAASVALRDLEAEAGIRRDVYKAFVARAQETGLQENLQVADASVISPAQVPLVPSQPKRRLILVLSLLGGLGFGLSAALYRARSRILARRRKAAIAQQVGASGATPPLVPDHGESHVIADLAMAAPLVEGDGLSTDEAKHLMQDFVDRSGPALSGLAARLTRPDQTAGPAVHVVFGTAASGATATLAFGLARILAQGGVEILLVDANDGPVTATGALIGTAARGIVDVDTGNADPGTIGTAVPDTSIVLLPAASEALRHRLAGYGERIVETIGDVADGFRHIFVDLGPSCPPALFRALSEIADDVLMVVDAAEAGGPDIGAIYHDLHDMVPALRGMVAVRSTADDPVTRRAVAIG